MRELPRVVLDACVLAPFAVCDLFLRLAEEPCLYSPCWTHRILAEVRRTQVQKLGWPEHLADYWQQEVTASFPEALVTGYEPLMGECRNAEEDRHVLAAAIRARASTIVTLNIRHFPAWTLKPHGIVTERPADFLIALHHIDSEAVIARIHDIARQRRLEPAEVVRRLSMPLPRFAEHLADRIGGAS